MEALSLIIYGPDGMGKTTAASHFPAPIFMGPEIKGSRFLKNVKRDKATKTYQGLTEALKKMLKEKPKDIKTVVIDSRDHIELDIHSFIKQKYNVQNLSKAAGGFGAGFKEAAEMQYELLKILEEIQEELSINIVLIAHSQVKAFNDPLTDEPYDRYELKLHESNSVSPRSMWREAVDGVFFLNQENVSKGEGKSVRASNNKKRYFFTERTPRFDAKSRFSIPAKVEFDLKINMYDLIYGYAFDEDVPLFDQAMKLYNSLEKEDPKILEFIEKVKDKDDSLRKVIVKLKGMK